MLFTTYLYMFINCIDIFFLIIWKFESWKGGVKVIRITIAFTWITLLPIKHGLVIKYE